jgi:hypothetical protein
MRMFLWWCRRFHHHRRGRDARGRLALICDSCGRAFPIVIADRKKADRLRQRMRQPASVVSLRIRRRLP